MSIADYKILRRVWLAKCKDDTHYYLERYSGNLHWSHCTIVDGRLSFEDVCGNPVDNSDTEAVWEEVPMPTAWAWVKSEKEGDSE